MVFTEVLQEVSSKIDDCIGLVVMGMDGIPIERCILDGKQNFDLLTTEATTLLRTTRQASEELGSGALKELIVMTEGMAILATAITDDYVLLGALRNGSNYGKARFHMKKAALRLEKEFV
jgi:predicted regulator of Ras-like GTPase activity (Roadblock/LC7/MglB family)